MTPDEARVRQMARRQRMDSAGHIIGPGDDAPNPCHEAEADLTEALSAWEQAEARSKQLEEALAEVRGLGGMRTSPAHPIYEGCSPRVYHRGGLRHERPDSHRDSQLARTDRGAPASSYPAYGTRGYFPAQA